MSDSDSIRRIADLTTLLEVSRQLGASTELLPLLERITDAAINVLECERATVFLYDAPSHELCSKVATGAEEIRFSADQGIAGECIRKGKTIKVSDAYKDPRFNREIDKTTGFTTRNMLTLPMKGHQGELVGVLQVLNKKNGPFTEHEEELADTLCSLAGVAVQRQMLLDDYAEKQKLERDLSLAREIQQSLIPDEDPVVEGYDIAGFNQPADATGGDCYDYLKTADGRTGLIVADATGHGIGPALVISQYRAMVRTLSSAETDIARIICHVNDLLDNDIPSGMFVTAFLGILNPHAGSVEYVSAGHGPLLLFKRHSQKGIEIEASTVPLGILSPMECDPASPICMDTGDVLLLVTDGFFEWANVSGEQFGTARIFDIVRDNPSATSRELIDLIREGLGRFAQGTPQADDLTAIVIRRI